MVGVSGDLRIGVRAALWAAMLGLAACRPAAATTARLRPATLRVQSYVEPGAITHLVRVGDHVVAASAQGLTWWDRERAVRVDGPSPASRLLAVAGSEEALWGATEHGVIKYTLHGADELAPAPIEVPPAAVRALAAAPEGGLWVGHAAGLHWVGDAWRATALTDPVDVVVAVGHGAAIAGGASGLWRVDAAVGAVPIASGLARVRLLVRTDLGGGGVLAVGDDARGRQRLALVRAGGVRTFRLLPDARWDAIAATRGAVYARAGARVVRLRDGSARGLGRRGARLLDLAGGPSSLAVDEVDVAVGDAPTALLADGDALWIGTARRGIAQQPKAGRRSRAWLRTGAFGDPSASLSVACRHANDCWLVTGAATTWRWDGAGFVPGPAGVVAVARRPDGACFGVRRLDDALEVIDLGRDVAVASVRLELGTEAIAFARFDPRGRLWIGQPEPAGGVALAVLELARSAAPRVVDAARHPWPTGVVDAAFGRGVDELFLATSAGVARVRAGQITTWDPAHGFVGGAARAVAASAAGAFAATAGGVAVFDGGSWRFPHALGDPARDVTITPDGVLWIATDRGVAVAARRRLHRVDVRRGLVENQVLDVVADHLGRVWARTPSSIALLTP